MKTTTIGNLIMKMPNNDFNSRINEMHHFQIGTKVIEWEGSHKTESVVVSIGGLFNSDHIQLDDKNSPWMIAGKYRRA